MKYILLILIKLYWFFIPENKRRHCIFRVSCSHKVYDVTKRRGLFQGIDTLLFRVRNCQPYYDIYTDITTGKKVMRLKTGVIIQEDEIAEDLL